MMDNEHRYSLCMEYPGRQGQPLFYRVADYNPDSSCFETADYTRREEADAVDVFQPTIIGRNPEEVRRDQIEIRRWRPKEEDNTKQWSFPYTDFHGNVYEIIKPAEIPWQNILLDDQSIRNILYSGITIDEKINEHFFIVIGKKENALIALQCNKSDFNQKYSKYYIQKNVTDILHTVHYFAKYTIPERDILNTEGLLKIVYNEFLNAERYFYCKTFLDLPSEKFYLRTPESYVNCFFSKYFKDHKDKLGLSKNEIRRFKDATNQAFESREEYEDFFKKTGFSAEIAAQAIKNYKQDISNIFLKSSDFEDMVNKCLLNNENVNEKCIQIVKNRWLQEQDAIKDKMQKEIVALSEKETQVLEELKKIKAEVKENEVILSNLLETTTQAQQQKKDADNRKAEIDAEIEWHIHKFKSDIIHATELIGVTEAISGIKKEKVRIDSGISLFVKPSEIYSKEYLIEEDIQDIKEFCSEVSDNLKQMGFEESIEIAATMIAAFLNGKSIILSDSVGCQVVNALSLFLDAATVEVINVPTGFSDTKQLIDTVNNASSKIVFIDGVLNSFNENAFVALNKFCTEKYLCFGVGTADTFYALSKNIWNYAIYLETESFLDFADAGPLTVGSINIEKLYQADEKSVVKEVSKKLKPLLKSGIISKRHYIEASMILTTYFQMVDNDKIGLLFSLSLYYWSFDEADDKQNILDQFRNCTIEEKFIEVMNKLR